MKHTVILDKPDDRYKTCLEVKLTPDRSIYLAEIEYTQEELDEFHAEAKNWILRCAGSRCFYADYESGEDATGDYCEYFDLTEEMAIFENGKFVGIYTCFDGFSYSGNGRASFGIDSWNFCNPFLCTFRAHKTHVCLFSQEETHRWNDEWTLLKREPDAKYASYLSF